MKTTVNDIVIKLKLTLEEMYSGVKKTVKYKINKPCTYCDASKSCSICFGKGSTLVETKEELTIKEGVENGMLIEIKGKGHFYKLKKKNILDWFSNNENDIGSLLVNIEEIKHPIFSRRNSDLIFYCRVKHSELKKADKQIEIIHLNKQVIKVLIPKNTADGTVMRIKGMGFRNIADNSLGSLLIVTKVING